MALSGILATTVSGLANASSRVAVAADNIVNVNTPGYQAKEVRSSTIVTRQNAGTGYASGGVSGVIRTNPSPAIDNGSNVDLATELVNLITATVAYKAGLTVIATGEELARELVDIKA